MTPEYHDEEILLKKKIEDYLYWKNTLNESTVHVMVADGTITLTGTIPEEIMRTAIEEDIRKISEQYTVDNQLTIWDSGRTKQHSGEELQSKVTRSLEIDLGVEESDVDVQVDKGHVTITGRVNAPWKKTQAEEIVTGIVGVTRFSNHLEVESLTDTPGGVL